MNKREFINELENRLAGLPADEITERLNFYGEMIDDRMEDGLSEEAAVADLGSIDALVSQTVADIPLAKLVKERVTPRRKPGALNIVLLVLGSPLWLAVLLVLFAVILTVYICLWAVVLCLWAAFLALCCGGLAGAAGGIFLAASKKLVPGLALLGCGLVCAGLAVLAFFGCKAVTVGILKLSKLLGIALKNCLIKKEKKQ